MEQAPQFQQPQQFQQKPYVVIMQTAAKPVVAEANPNYKRKYAKSAGIAQIIVAIALIGLNSGLAAKNHDGKWAVGTGWWTAPLIIIAGICGIVSSYRPRTCIIVCTLVFSIFSAIAAILTITFGAISIADLCNDDCGDDDRGHRHRHDSHEDDDDDDDDCSSQRISLQVMAGFFLVFAIATFIISVVQSVVCCQGTCSRGKPTPQTNQVSQYNNGFSACYIDPQAQHTSARVHNGPKRQDAYIASGQNAINFMMESPALGGATSASYDEPPPPYTKAMESGSDI